MSEFILGYAPTAPAGLYACLLQSPTAVGPLTTDTGTTIANGGGATATEPSNAGYARQSIGLGSANWNETLADPLLQSNKNIVNFSAITGGGVGYVPWFAVTDQASAGNMLFSAPAYVVGSNGVLTVSSITVSGTTATLTTSSAHGFTSGDVISVIGNVAGLNGNQAITVSSATVFTYAVTGGTGNGSGTMTCWKPIGIGPGITPQLPIGDFVLQMS